ncbi:MAG: IS3 family transposase [Candidatus Binatia bacterium]
MADRQSCIELVEQAKAGGARRQASCAVLEVSLRTVERWEKAPDQGDRRRGPVSTCAHALSEEEKQTIVEVSSGPAYRDLSPWQIVARLADTGRYLGSESSFYRVLKQNDLMCHRHNSKPRVHHRPKGLAARNPNQVWSWDITYLNSPIRGAYYYLYLVEDIYSRMIVGWRIEEVESAEHAGRLIERISQEQGIAKGQLTLHSDNGAPMKGVTLLATLERMGVASSFSRPGVSDDNPYSESLFKTLKYRPSYPESAFGGIDQAREWVSRFVTWYNTAHLHSAIRFVTPSARHQGLDKAILAKRSAVYEKAKRLNPLRWSGPTRNWAPITEVMLNPKKHKSETYGELTIDTATAAQKPAASAMSNTVKQISNAGGDSSKNGFHKCPITNASDAGEGLPMPKNKLSDELRRSPLPSSKLRVEGTTTHPPSENLT